MARYIDADALMDELKELRVFWGYTFTGDGIDEAIDKVEEAPDADVVPKSEVESEIKVWQELYADTVDKWEKAYEELEIKLENEKAEVAREIFEEIEREINDALQSNYQVLPQIEESEALWNRVGGKIDALRGIDGFIEELKEKYNAE